jgi:ubiquinone/menaquinone biosynthesis C-methylase UbiE
VVEGRRRLLIGALALLAALGALAWLLRADLKRWAYEQPGRDAWQQPDRVVQALEVRPGARVADVGAGGGYFTFRLARAVGPSGLVYAVDVDPQMTAYIAERARAESLTNVEAVLAAPDDPGLPREGVDLVFVCNTFHHISNRADYFRRLRAHLRPGGRLAVVDYKPEGWFARLFRHATPPEVIRSELQAAGYRLQREHDFLDRQSFLIFEPGA